MSNWTFDFDSFFTPDVLKREQEKHRIECQSQISKPQELPPTVLPKIKVRFLSNNLLLAKPVLSRMLYVTRPAQANPFPVRAPSTNYLDDSNIPIPYEVFNARVEKLFKYLFDSKAQRPWVELDFLDCSLLELALRGLPGLVKHKRLDPPREDYIPAAKRLMRVLENLRRRARRAAIGSLGKERYEKIAQRWRQYERDLRRTCINSGLHYSAVYFRVSPTPSPPSLQRRQDQKLITEVVKIAEAELKEEKLPIPESTLLRKWARTLVRNVRRGREFGNDPQFLITTVVGKSTIRSYMRTKVHKLMSAKKGRREWEEEYQQVWEKEGSQKWEEEYPPMWTKLHHEKKRKRDTDQLASFTQETTTNARQRTTPETPKDWQRSRRS